MHIEIGSTCSGTTFCILVLLKRFKRLILNKHILKQSNSLLSLLNLLLNENQMQNNIFITFKIF